MSRVTYVAAIALALRCVSPLSAVDLDVTSADIEAVLKMARGPEGSRTRFHAPYVFTLNGATVERIEVVTEQRRLMQIAEVIVGMEAGPTIAG